MFHVVRSGLLLTVLCGFVAASGAMPAQARASIGKYSYPDQVVQTYLEACGGTGTDRVAQPVVHAVCVCTIAEFQNTFSLQEFRELGQAIAIGREVPVMDQIMLDCARLVMLRDNG
jgi:hypothetical protein